MFRSTHLATAVGLALLTPLTLVVGDDYDDFGFTLQAGETITLDALFSHAQGNCDLVLREYVGGCGANVAFATSPTDNEQIVFTNTGFSAMDYVLQVDLVTGGPCLDDSLTWTKDRFATGDLFDSNDDCSSARMLPAIDSTFKSLTALLGDNDDYGFALAPNETIELDATFLHAAGDLDLELSDVGCPSVLTSSTSTSNSESVSYTNTTSGFVTVTLRVFVYPFSAGTCATYDLGVRVSGSPCGPDDGLTAGGSTPALRLGEVSLFGDLRVTTGQRDVFRIQGTQADAVGIRIDFEHDDGDIDFDLFEVDMSDGTETYLTGSYSVDDFEEYRGFIQNTNVELRLEVYRLGGGDGCSRYSLAVMGGRYGDDRTLCQGEFVGPFGLPASLTVGGSRVVADDDVSLTVNGATPLAFGIFINSRGSGVFTPLDRPSSPGSSQRREIQGLWRPGRGVLSRPRRRRGPRRR